MLLCYFYQSELHLSAIVQSVQFLSKDQSAESTGTEGQVDGGENQEKSVLFRLVGDSVTALSNLGAQWMLGGKKVAGIDIH